MPLWAVPVRLASFNIKEGIPDPVADPARYEAIKSILSRIDADVVGLQEMRRVTRTNFDRMAGELGYTHTVFSSRSPLDIYNSTAVMSRFPILNAEEILSPPGASEMTRMNLAVSVDVPGTDNDPTVLVVHYKCCGLADNPINQFRRAVEIRRTLEFLSARNLTSADNIFVIGDFNLVEQNREILELPTGLPGAYVPGADLTFPMRYWNEPDAYFEPVGFAKLPMRQLSGSTTTYSSSSGSSTLDYLVASAAVRARHDAESEPHTEIYNSFWDANGAGLDKVGNPLPAGTSALASDHYPIFGDFELDDLDLPALELVAGMESVFETDPPGSVEILVRLPLAPPPGGQVTVFLSSFDERELVLSANEVVFEEGVTEARVWASPVNDGVADGHKKVRIRAMAEGYANASVWVFVKDVSLFGSREFTSQTLSIEDRFTGFNGTANPEGWSVVDAQGAAASEWQGTGSGSSSTGGLWSYGIAGDGSLGFLPSSTRTITASTTFYNSTGEPIEALDVAYDAEQWRSANSGHLNGWTVEIEIDGVRTALPELDFTPTNTLTNGAIPGGLTTSRFIRLENLKIPDGAAFTLHFRGANSSPNGTGFRQGIAIDNLVVVASLAEPVDRIPPQLAILGANPMRIRAGDLFSDPGAIAIDDNDEPVPVLASGAVDVSTVGTYWITYEAIDAAGNLSTASRAVLVLSGYDYELQVSKGLGGSDALPLSDPDGDGVVNLVEYALGGDAAVADGGGFAPIVEFFEESLQITAQIRNDPGIGVEALATGDLAAGWSSSGVREVVGMDQSDVPPGFVRRAWTVDAAGEPRYFLRLGVTLLPEAGILE
jgi:exonuclease III